MPGFDLAKACAAKIRGGGETLDHRNGLAASRHLLLRSDGGGIVRPHDRAGGPGGNVSEATGRVGLSHESYRSDGSYARATGGRCDRKSRRARGSHRDLHGLAIRSLWPSLAPASAADLSQRGPATPDHILRTKRLPMLGRDVPRMRRRIANIFRAMPLSAKEPKTMLDPAPRVILDPRIWPGRCRALREGGRHRSRSLFAYHRCDLAGGSARRLSGAFGAGVV